MIINKGKKVAEGTPFELKDRYAKDSLKLYFANERRDKVLHILGKENITSTSYGGLIEASDPFMAARTAGKLEGVIDGFEIVQGKMDDVFLNVTNNIGRAV